MLVSATGDAEPEHAVLGALVRRARFRQLACLPVVWLIVYILLTSVAPVLGRDPHGSGLARHLGDPSIYVGAVVGYGLLGLGALAAGRRQSLARQIAVTSLAWGLPRRQRRSVRRAVRQGRDPSPDPILRLVEYTHARQAVAHGQLRLAVGVLTVLFTLTGALAPGMPARIRIPSSVLAGLVIFAFVQAVLTARGAGRYLQRPGPSVGAQLLVAEPATASWAARRLQLLWTPLAAGHRVWFTRALVALGGVVAGGGAGAVALLTGVLLQHLWYPISIGLILVGVMIIVLIQLLELLFVACILSGAWMFLRARRSDRRA